MVGRTGNFKQFCMSHATPKHVDITDSMDINPSYEGVVAITITNLKNKIDIFDRISIPYIEDRFENEDDVKACLDLKDMGDIPSIVCQWDCMTKCSMILQMNSRQ